MKIGVDVGGTNTDAVVLGVVEVVVVRVAAVDGIVFVVPVRVVDVAVVKVYTNTSSTSVGLPGCVIVNDLFAMAALVASMCCDPSVAASG